MTKKKTAKKKTKKKAKKKTAKEKPVIDLSTLPKLIKVDDLATLIGVSRMRVSQLVSEGMPKNGRGQYDLKACVHWYLDFWKQRATGENDEKKAKQINLIDAQRDKIVLETEKLRETLLPVEEVAHTLNAVAVIVSTQLDGLGARMANTLSGIDDPAEIQRTLFDECREIRSNIADNIEDLAIIDNLVVNSTAAA